MAYTWSNINNGDSALSVRTKLNGMGSQVSTDSTNIDTLFDDVKSLSGNYNSTLITNSTWLYSLSVTASGSFTGSVYYDTSSAMGIVTASSALTSGTSYTIATLPTGYRPTTAISDYDSVGNVINITTGGVVSITPISSISSSTVLYFYLNFGGVFN